jgi:RNA polymerase sigma factor (sigma-70 family)
MPAHQPEKHELKAYPGILFPYAYNILGSSEDARDAVQDVLSNFISSSKEGIENEKGYLIKSVINQAINMRNKRKKMSGGEVWLPEPFATEEADTDINLREIVSYSMLVMLEQLNPKERAVFILKEGFGYSHEEIAEVFSGTVEHSRKLLSRARVKLDQPGRPAKVSGTGTPSPGLLERYIQAIRDRDTKTLEGLLADDIAFYADGGDQVKVIKKICKGIHDVADLLVLLYHKFQTSQGVVPAIVNHQPALLYYEEDRLKACQVFGLSPTRDSIQQISTILDPEKLKNIPGIRPAEPQSRAGKI